MEEGRGGRDKITALYSREFKVYVTRGTKNFFNTDEASLLDYTLKMQYKVG